MTPLALTPATWHWMQGTVIVLALFACVGLVCLVTAHHAAGKSFDDEQDNH